MYSDGHSSLPVFLLASLLILFPGCSIKEDRDVCPCILRLDLSEAMEAADGQLLLMLSDADGKVLLRDTLRAPSKQYSAAIPRLPDQSCRSGKRKIPG